MKTKTALQRLHSHTGKAIFRRITGMILLFVMISRQTSLAQDHQVSPLPRPILFKNVSLPGVRNISGPGHLTEQGLVRILKDSLNPAHYKNRNYVLLQFDRVPGVRERQELAGKGFRLYDYIPGNAFLAETPDSFSNADLTAYSVGGIYTLPVKYKIAKNLEQNADQHSYDPDKLIAVSFFGTITKADAGRALEEAGASVVTTKIQPDRVLFIRAGKSALQRIANLPFVSFLSLQPMKPVPLNYNNRAAHGLDALNAPSGRNLQGEGVTIGIGDDSDPYTHVDFTGRLIERFPSAVNYHGTHTSGTLAGGGILDPRYKGMAPHATLVNQYFSDILVNAPTYITDYNMVLTSNSYTNYDPGCINDGEYDALSNFLDAQAISYPGLLHDFAAGNDGAYTCTPYAAPFYSIKSGFQTAKNILTIGAFDNLNYVINYTSSAGPTDDGRLKPEIVAGGMNITSTFPYNTYGPESGTSMACPTVTGTLALLEQRYRQLHGGANPSAALIKTLISNSATDVGNPGPDYIFGFGTLNARTAIEALENNQYFTGTIPNAGNNTFTLSGVPSGLQQIKIMLYWPDVPAAPFAASVLVNNLDLTVNSPDAVLHHPMILNPAPAHVNDIAIEGVDNLNNIEQVVINNPPGGNFTISVNGTNVPAGPQNYVVAYQFIKPSVTLVYPYGNETWVPGQQEIIRWNAYGGDPNSFTISYSPDNGNTWSTISNAVPSASRMYTWTVPATATNQGLIRIARNGTGYSDISTYNFTILGQPVLTATNPCQGYAQLNWSAVPSATGYEIMQLKGDTMSTVATTVSPNYLLGPLNRDSSYWLAVRALNSTSPGRRSLAVNVSPAGGACALTALNNDLSVDSLISPLSGRQFTSTQLSSSSSIQVVLKNLGTIPTSMPVNLFYQVNGGPVVAEMCNAIIGAGSNYKYTFSNKYDLSSPGVYNLQVWIGYPGDPQSGNDTLHAIVKQLQNAPVLLAPSFTEGFETGAPVTSISPAVGLPGLDRFDFTASNSNGRARTFINTGFARTGNRCATLDQSHYNASSTADSLTATINLSNYLPSDQIWLDFWYRNQGNDFTLPGNQVWIRGNDQAPWIPVYTLDTQASMIGSYQPSASIDITGTLAGATPAQTLSSSFQIRFGEQGYTSANSVITDGDLDDGYSFDDITITRSSNDIAMRSLVSPNPSGICNLSGGETISVLVRNYSASPATNIPVSYSINGLTVTENIPVINAQDSVVYHFTHTADLSAFRSNSLTAWVSYPSDNYQRNDTLPVIAFQTAPLITVFPYLEGFENNNGSWYTNGVNDSWQWGTPAKKIINRAANGSKCWVTSLTGDYNNSESSYLYSPCFDLSGLTSPVLSFSHIFQTEDDCDCDYHWVEYSVDGTNWTTLGMPGGGTHWYDNLFRDAWQISDTIWHVSSYDIPVRSSKVRFRFVMKSDPGTTYEGVGIDDIHIFDKTPIYNGPSISSGLSQPVSGSSWIDFDMGGSRILSINPNGQDLGNTQVGVYIYNGTVRNDGKQYYLNRNIVIQPANPPVGNVSVRYYFLDKEADSLILAAGCNSCTTIHDAYQAGITQYSSPVLSEEDSTLSNNHSGTFHYLLPHRDISIIPYDKGYYAEYQVSGFSEFWINNGTPGLNQPLPLALLNFTAARSGKGALLQWSTTGEMNTSRYIIEKSVDGISFPAIDSLKADGDSSNVNNYRYTDNHLWNGVNYYRLKLVALDGSFSYSSVRIIHDTLNSLVISIYPNPVQTGILYISSSANAESLQITDISGRVILKSVIHGFLNTIPLDRIAKGVYFVQVQTDAGMKVSKILVR